MAEEGAQSRAWRGRALVALGAVAVIFAHMLPLSTVPPAWAPPDVLLSAALALSVHRPAAVPIWLIAAIFLAADVALGRPIGLGAALAVLGCEALRRRATRLRTGSWVAEWIYAAIAIVLIAVAGRVALTIVIVPQPPMALTVSAAALTLLVHPVVIALLRLPAYRREGRAAAGRRA
ncbi:MAG: rod shape-determining protein MreD [Paracoccaceae bacterium]